MSSRPPITMVGLNSSTNSQQKPHADSVLRTIPTAPTLSLPPLGRLATHSTEQVEQALNNLRCLYFPSAAPSTILESSNLTIPKRSIQHLIHDTSVPDSGYASAEEDEGEGEDEDVEDRCSQSTADSTGSDEESENDAEIDILRGDPLERAFTIKWVTGFIARSDIWLSAASSQPEEAEKRSDILDEATSLLAAFSGHDDEEDVALTRAFSFPLSPNINGSSNSKARTIHVELNDAPLSKDDHTSVGLQSWGSSILLAERFCLQPSFFSLSPPPTGDKPLRLLELGAGTGMLSIVVAKFFSQSSTLAGTVQPEIVATDYHPDVLDNLAENVKTNFPPSPSSPSSSSNRRPRPPVVVTSLDWEHPTFSAPLDAPFDVILAADVIYHPCHARWIKQCVEKLLSSQGAFWLIIPLRTTGRHEGMDATVDKLFPDVSSSSSSSSTLVHEGRKVDEGHKEEEWELAVLYREEVGRQGNIGRADEGGYKLFKIGWVNAN